MSSIDSLSSISAKTGIGGLVFGMNIDELVESLTMASRKKILKQQQNVQLLQWKQTACRSVSEALKEFQSNYLDVLSKTNFRSQSFFNTVAATASSTAVGVTTTSSASAGSMTINSITQLATSQVTQSKSAVTKPLSLAMPQEGNEGEFLDSLSGKSISITLDGKMKTITFNQNFMDQVNNPETGVDFSSRFAAAFQGALDDAFGTYSDGTTEGKKYIQVQIGSDNNITLSAPGSQIIVNAVGEDMAPLNTLGLQGGQSNKISTHTPLERLTLGTPLNTTGDKFEFNINGVNFSFNKSDSLSTVLGRVNNSDAGVILSYSSITDKFTLTAKNQGAGDNIRVSDKSGNLMEALQITKDTADVTQGKNAILNINGVDIIRSSNSFEIDGVNLELKELSDTPIEITMKEDATSLLEPIKKFVEDYNAMMDLMNGLVKEKVYRDFPPLSDEQKNEMSEKEIEKWEEKAKSGVLRGDRTLQSIATKLQTTLSGLSVEGFSLYSLGITSAGYQENGKLKIDEKKLTKALETNGAEIRALFTSENGLGSEINNIINEAVKTSGPKGQRGSLIEMAGLPSTRSDTENSIHDTIERTNKIIETLKTRLTAEESRLWKSFTAMENAIQQLNVQSSILMQFSGNQNY
jgi:flagellar hook-associated protein 2